MDGYTPNAGEARRIDLLIVDDHALCRAGLATMFRAVARIGRLVVAGGAEDAVHLAAEFGPSVVLMDVTLPAAYAFEAARSIRAAQSDAGILFLDESVHPAHVRQALSVGGAGYWTKHATFDEIVEAVRLVGTGQQSFCPAVRQHLVVTSSSGLRYRPMPSDIESLDTLTAREMDVLAGLARGLSVKQCAQHLRLARSTVDNHKSRLMKKLKVHKTVDLARLAMHQGLID